MFPARAEGFGCGGKRVVWAFLLRFALILSVYLYPWRPVATAYASAAAALGNLVVGDAPQAGVHLRFRSTETAATEARDAFGIELRAEDAITGSVVRVPIDLRTLTYLPTAVFIALAIASPIWQGSRGARVLLAGLGVLQVFLGCSIAAPLMLFFANPLPLHLVDLGPTTYRVLDVLYRALVAPPGMAFAVPGGIWLLMLWVVPEPNRSPAAVMSASDSAFREPVELLPGRDLLLEQSLSGRERDVRGAQASEKPRE